MERLDEIAAELLSIQVEAKSMDAHRYFRELVPRIGQLKEERRQIMRMRRVEQALKGSEGASG
jgi:hypothetical protein